MYKNIKVFQPNKFFFRVDFETIKKILASQSQFGLKDYGSIVIIDYTDHAISVNNIGKVEVFFNKITRDKLDSLVEKVQTVFQSQINDFKLLY